jgi:hypothetical protein
MQQPQGTKRKHSTDDKVNVVIACTGYTKGRDFPRIIDNILLKTMARYGVDKQNIYITTVSKDSEPVPFWPGRHPTLNITEIYGGLQGRGLEFDGTKGDIIEYLSTQQNSVDVIVLGGCNNMDWVFPRLECVKIMYDSLTIRGCVFISESADVYKKLKSYPFLSAEMLESGLNVTNGPVITATFNCYFEYVEHLAMYAIRPPKEVIHRLLLLIKDEQWNEHYMMKLFKTTEMIQELIRVDEITGH